MKVPTLGCLQNVKVFYIDDNNAEAIYSNNLGFSWKTAKLMKQSMQMPMVHVLLQVHDFQ